jgi:endogenous inhibitor of DNA gyrase (YacG/DUF329 family)
MVMSMSPKPDPACPLCRRQAVREFAPFCSARCQDRDLLNWLDGGYSVPITDDMTEQESGLDSEGNDRL